MDKDLEFTMQRMNISYQDLIHQWSQEQLKLIYGDIIPTPEQMIADDVIIEHNGVKMMKRSDYRCLKNYEQVGETFLVWRQRTVTEKKNLQKDLQS